MNVHLKFAVFKDFPGMKLTRRFLLLELTKRADVNGRVRMAYSYMKERTGGARRTMIRNIAWLVDQGILHKRVIKLGRSHYDINVYTLRIPFARNTAHPFSGDTVDKMASNPVKPKDIYQLSQSVREEIATLEKGLHRFPPIPGSDREMECHKELRRLRALLGPPGMVGTPQTA